MAKRVVLLALRGGARPGEARPLPGAHAVAQGGEGNSVRDGGARGRRTTINHHLFQRRRRRRRRSPRRQRRSSGKWMMHRSCCCVVVTRCGCCCASSSSTACGGENHNNNIIIITTVVVVRSDEPRTKDLLLTSTICSRTTGGLQAFNYYFRHKELILTTAVRCISVLLKRPRAEVGGLRRLQEEERNQVCKYVTLGSSQLCNQKRGAKRPR